MAFVAQLLIPLYQTEPPFFFCTLIIEYECVSPGESVLCSIPKELSTPSEPAIKSSNLSVSKSAKRCESSSTGNTGDCFMPFEGSRVRLLEPLFGESCSPSQPRIFLRTGGNMGGEATILPSTGSSTVVINNLK